jgi:hypothetical protein
MFSLDPELARLRDDGVLGEATAARLIALERREVVSLYGELRFLTWAGVMLIVAGVGVIVSKNFDRIGPLAIAIAIAAAALACYAYSEWRRRSSKTPAFKASLLDDYILLLGALLLSADVGFIEHQWHLLGDNWQRHFLLLAVIHGVTAYVFASRMLLSLSISALAAFLGIERRIETLFSATDMAARAFVCAAIVFAWRVTDGTVRARLAVIPSRGVGKESSSDASAIARDSSRSSAFGMTTPFTPVFDHFATNLAFWGALILASDRSLYPIGCLLALSFAVISARHGLKEREELFVIYAWVYGVIAIDMLVFRLVHEPILVMLFGIVSTTAAIVGLFVIHMRMRGGQE